MIENVRNLGFKVVYAPDAIVHHLANSSRATFEYFRERYERWAIETAFDCFRKNGKFQAAIHLCRYALRRFLNARRSSEGKIKPEYFQTIQRKIAFQTIKQIIRVFMDKSLYRHIRQIGYL